MSLDKRYCFGREAGMNILTLNLIGEYFHDIREGRKAFEYRLRTDHWRKRLEAREYEMIKICWGYPRADNADRQFLLPWAGCELQTIQHKHFGPDPVEVYAIRIVT